MTTAWTSAWAAPAALWMGGSWDCPTSAVSELIPRNRAGAV